jgi:hypothetical protein
MSTTRVGRLRERRVDHSLVTSGALYGTSREPRLVQRAELVQRIEDP